MSKKRKNSNYKYSAVPLNTDKPRRSFLKIFTLVFISAVILFGVTLGAVSAILNANAVFKYEGVSLGGGEVNYLASYYKYRYMASLSSGGVSVSDTSEFWNSTAEGDKTYLDLLKEKTESYIKEMLVAVYLFDSYSKLSSSEKDKIASACDEVLDYKADGDTDAFNSMAKRFGFDFKSFKKATTLLYKAAMAQDVIYGANGENMKNFPDLCERYLNVSYSHVHLIFIRTENTFVVNEDGNRVQGDDGYDLTRPLTDEEKAERLGAIARLDEMILGLETQGDMQISPEMFFEYQKKYDEGDYTKYGTGYYFAKNSDYSKEFSSAFAQVVNASLEMKVSSYKKIKTDVGYCFIYKDKVESGAYASADKDFFTDFYADSAAASFSDSIVTLSEGVRVGEDFFELDLLSLPYNNNIIARIER